MIVKIKNSSYFAQISNDVLRDKRLSLEARGALCEMLSYSEHFTASVDSLMRLWQIGRKKLLGITGELKAAGYLEIKPIRDRKGKIIDKEWIFYGASQTDRRNNDKGDAPPNRFLPETSQDVIKGDPGQPAQDAPLAYVGQTLTLDKQTPPLKDIKTDLKGFKKEDLKNKREREEAQSARPPAESDLNSSENENPFIALFFVYFPNQHLDDFQRHLIKNRITDLIIWKKTLEYWRGNNSKSKNVGTICTKYDELTEEIAAEVERRVTASQPTKPPELITGGAYNAPDKEQFLDCPRCYGTGLEIVYSDIGERLGASIGCKHKPPQPGEYYYFLQQQETDRQRETAA